MRILKKLVNDNIVLDVVDRIYEHKEKAREQLTAFVTIKTAITTILKIHIFYNV